MQTRISRGQFGEVNAIFMENDTLRAVILPAFGGKIASLFHIQNRFELLFQNPKSVFTAATSGASFADYEACGFDDVFPAVNTEDVETDSGRITYPDHGEVWTTPMRESLNGVRITLDFTSRLLPYRFEKSIALEDDHLRLRYTIQNVGTFDFPYIFLAHCLVNTRAGMELILPRGAGEKGWRMDGDRMSKWYLKDPVREGECGYWFPRENMKALFSYPRKRLPYLGYWITEGGFRGDHNCALEPASAYFDAVSIAKQNRRESILHAGETISFPLSIQLTDAGPLQEKHAPDR